MQRITISLMLYTYHRQNYAPGEVLKATDSFSWDVCDHIRHKNSTLGSPRMELIQVIDPGACTLHRLVPEGEREREIGLVRAAKFVAEFAKRSQPTRNGSGTARDSR
ncbi:hypothetical protein V1477_006500 [Vespula maculifrons]